MAIEPGRRAVIVDWKTSARRPTGAWLAARLQTRVYRYVLVRAGAHLNAGTALAPEQVEMIYWFAAFPDQPERLPYNRTQHEADGRYLASLIADLVQAGEAPTWRRLPHDRRRDALPLLSLPFALQPRRRGGRYPRGG